MFVAFDVSDDDDCGFVVVHPGVVPDAVVAVVVDEVGPEDDATLLPVLDVWILVPSAP